MGANKNLSDSTFFHCPSNARFTNMSKCEGYLKCSKTKSHYFEYTNLETNGSLTPINNIYL